jgi:hypothetical protein
MTSGRKAEPIGNLFLYALLVSAFVAFAPRIAQADSAGNFDLAELMDKLAGVRTAEGRFVERKYVSILSEPLVMAGSVRYQAPDYIRKEYEGPDRESYEVRGDHLTIEFPDGRRRDVSIGEHPVLHAFVESYRSTLAGDVETLQRYFELELGGRMDDWLLRLIPRRDDRFRLQRRDAGGQWRS